MDREALAWAAGFFDGEGYIGVPKLRKGRQIVLDVGQVDREVLDRMHRALGVGSVVGPYRYAKRPTHQAHWRFQIHNFEHVQAAVAMLWPWLGTVKRLQAAAALATVPRRLARNRPQPTCARGHDWSDVYIAPDGTRQCRPCRRERYAEQRLRGDQAGTRRASA